MTNKQKNFWGIFCLVAPISILVLNLVAYSIFSFVLSAIAGGVADEPTSVVFNVISLILGLVGILALIAIPVGLVLGIIFLALKKKEEVAPTEQKEIK